VKTTSIVSLAKYFRKSIHMLVFSKYFYKKKKSKLYFRDRVAVLNDLPNRREYIAAASGL
jgi:hypothetical protein